MRGTKGLLCQVIACIATIGSVPVVASGDTFEVVNTATATFDGAETVSSNTVDAVIAIPPPDIEFFADASFTKHRTAARSGTPLYVQVEAAGCENDPNAVGTFSITITSKVSGDVETYTAIETGNDTAIFRVGSLIMTKRITGAIMEHNGLLELWGEDSLAAEVKNCAGSDVDNLLIDPVGVVFDSKTNEPIAGASVRLIDVTGAGNGGFPGGDATVLDFDGVTRAPSVVVSDAEGDFQFPLVALSEYRLLITPPGNYKYPSTRATADLSATRIINLSGSYGGAFPINEPGAVMPDIPLDTDETGLVVEKRASRTTVQIAESVQYSVDMRNISGIDLLALTLHDDLPAGFSYVPGSARMDDVKIADPQGGKGPSLQFAVSPIAANASATLTYRVLVGPGAMQGDGVNTAQLISTRPARKVSNITKAKVKVEGGVFDDRAYVLGKVFADCNSNGVQDAGEAGIPRVRLYMEDGSFVISDSEGKYSFYGVTPRTHVLKVDATTMPHGATLAALSHRNAGSGSTRFLDVQRSELHRADFATTACSPALLEEIAVRRQQDAGSLGRELDLGVKTELQTQEQANALVDARSLPASGIVGETAGTRVTLETLVIPANSVPASKARSSLQSLLPRLNNTLDFVGIQDGDALGVNQATLRVKGVAQATIELQVNDVAIGRDRIGLTLTDTARQIQAIEYVGVDLAVGENRLKLVQRDVGGNIRAIREITIVAAGVAGRVTISVADAGVPADGEHSAAVNIEVQDVNGVPVAARTAITLEASMGDWTVSDLDPNEPGVQTFVEGGQAEYLLRSPMTVGSALVRVTSGEFDASTQISFIAALRPLLAAGVLEGTLNLNKLDAKSLLPTRREDGFERELTTWSTGDGKSGGAARAALFLKGKIRGDYLLTMGYDSDKDTNERLFRDIQPDQFYPVYGDSSVKGFDAQSTSRLYVRIDRNKSFLLAGDITTQSLSQARMLGAYNRSLTGIKEHFETDHITVDAFASHDTNRQVVQEVPANGTSGPFFLGNLSAIENSERIEILTRDRDQPAVIIQTVVQQRFTDYEIEPLSGRILFRGPIASVDPDLNPISIRITYEVDQGGDEFWTVGVDSQIRLTDRVEVGAAVIDDRNPLDARRIASTNATIKLGEVTSVTAEVARTERELQDDGLGRRIELKHEGAALQVRAYGGRTDAAFDNPSATMSANRSEAGAKAGYSITERTRLVGEALHSADVTTDAARDGAIVGVEQSFGQGFKGEVGVRHVRDEQLLRGVTETSSVRTKLTAPVPHAPRASVFGEYEQDVQEQDSRVIAAGGHYQLANRSKLYARHEFISSLSGPYQLDPTQKHNTTVFGVDTSYMENDHLFSEYRIADALSGRQAQAAIGLRNGWQLARGIRANTSVERVDALSGSTLGDNAAVTGALEYTRNPLWKGTARLELRQSDSSDGVLSTLGLAYKLSNDWTFLGKNVYALTDGQAAQPDRIQDRLQFGFAYRDSDTNRTNALARYEFKTEEGLEFGLKRTVHIVSMHADYQVTQKTLWRVQYAAKIVDEKVDGLDISSSAHLIGGRVTRDMGTKFDAGIHVRALFNGQFDGYQGGVGAEAGYLIHDNLWVSVGYNVLGFRDKDLTAEEYTNLGAYLRLRFKFDESLLEGL